MKIQRITKGGLLKFNNLTAITSKTVADALGVKHRDLLLNVKKAEKYAESQVRSHTPHFNPIFQDYTYESRGKTYNCKLMNEDGVKALIKVVDTQEAYNYFVMLMSDFNSMKLEREARKAVISPTKTLNKLLDILQQMLKEELPKSAKPKFIYIHVQNAINKTVLGKSKGVDRETLDHLQLEEIDYLERVFVNRIISHIHLGFTAEEIRLDVLDLARYLQQH